MIFSALSLSCFVGLGNTKDRDIQPKIECPAVIHPHSLGEILFSPFSEPSVCVCQDVWRWDGRPDQEVPNKKHLFNPRFKINKFPTSSHFYFFPHDYESVTIIRFQVLRAIGTGGLHSFTRHGGLFYFILFHLHLNQTKHNSLGLNPLRSDQHQQCSALSTQLEIKAITMKGASVRG